MRRRKKDAGWLTLAALFGLIFLFYGARFVTGEPLVQRVGNPPGPPWANLPMAAAGLVGTAFALFKYWHGHRE